MMKHKTNIKGIHRVIREEQKTAAQVKNGAAGIRDATVKMKRVTKGAPVTKVMGSVGREAEVAMLQKLSETDDRAAVLENGHGATVPLDVEKAAIVAIAAGASPSMVEREFDLHQNYVAYALKRRFGSADAAKKALQGLVLENALACQVHGGAHLTEMSAPQAFMSSAVLIDKALALEKSMEGTVRTVDFGALATIGKTLNVLKDIVNPPASQSPSGAQ